MGVLYVAAGMRPKYDVEVIDLNGRDYFPDIKADLYGITATSAQIMQAKRILDRLRERGRSLVLIGGPHATVAPGHCLDLGFDAVVKGEMDEREAWTTEIDRQRVYDTFPVENLDSIPFPARDLIDIHSYRYELNGKKTTSIITSRGCPYQCAFCSKTFPKPVRYRSSDNVLAEAREVKEMGFDGLMFYDDEMLVSKGRDWRIFCGLKELGMVYRCFTRANLIDEDSAQLMANTGCVEVLIGVESGSDRILKNVNKGTTREKNLQAVALLKKYGIRVKAAFIVGLPGESEKSIADTESFVEEAQPDDVDFTILSVYPGSPIWDHPENYDLEFSRDGYLPFKGKPGEYASSVRTGAMGAEKIVEARDYLEGKFKKKELLR